MPRVDEKSQMQALDRTQPTLPMQPSLPRRRTHDYVCRCTTTLFAALEVATGKVTGICQEFLRFLSSMSRAYPDQELHLVMDNYAAHKRIEFRQWLTDNPRIRVPFHPPHLGVLAQSGRGLWFGIIECQAIQRGTFGNVRELTTAIRTFITGWNKPDHPFAGIAFQQQKFE